VYVARHLGFKIDSIDFDVTGERDEVGVRF